MTAIRRDEASPSQRKKHGSLSAASRGQARRPIVSAVYRQVVQKGQCEHGIGQTGLWENRVVTATEEPPQLHFSR